MRVNLNVPYEEKDKARRLGACWDAARKTWYVENVENMGDFLSWIPGYLKRPGAAPAPRTMSPLANANAPAPGRPPKNPPNTKKKR